MSEKLENKSGEAQETVATLKAKLAEQAQVIAELNEELVRLGITIKKGKPVIMINKKNYSLASPRFLHPVTGAEVNINNIGEIVKDQAQFEILLKKGALVEEGGGK
jgi:hypothetical protein